jgi:hypothetical protein
LQVASSRGHEHEGVPACGPCSAAAGRREHDRDADARKAHARGEREQDAAASPRLRLPGGEPPQVAPGRRRPVQRRVLAKDRLFELSEPRAGLEPEIVDEARSRRAIGLEGIRLPPAAIERKHQLSPQPLAQGMLAHERLELGDEPPMAPERQLSLHPILDGREPQPLETLHLGDRERPELDIGERRAPPQRLGLAYHRRRARGVALLKRPPSFRHQHVEPGQVELVRLKRYQVSGRARDDTTPAVARSQQLPQTRHLDAEPMLRLGIPAEQLVDQPIERYDTVWIQEQNREQGAQLRPWDRQRFSVPADLERPQDPEVEARAGHRCASKSAPAQDGRPSPRVTRV